MPNNVRDNRVNCSEGRLALAQNAAIGPEIANPGKVSNRPGCEGGRRVRPLKSAPDPWIELPSRGPRPFRVQRDEASRWLDAPRPRDPITFLFTAIWGIATLPFRLVFGVFGLVGRLAVLSIGFSLMVLGAAMSAGPMAMLGIPVFIFGLILSMRSL
jgi:hypothetical protein